MKSVFIRILSAISYQPTISTATSYSKYSITTNNPNLLEVPTSLK